MLFLELGCVPLRLIIRSKRMNFLHYILNQPDESIIKSVFNEQLSNPSRNDWVKLIDQDMKCLKIGLTYDKIQIMSKNSFKNFINKKIREAALEYLTILKKKHSKVDTIEHASLQIQAYFSADDSEKTIKNIQDLFKIRSRMLDVKTNYKGNYTEYNCDECKIIGLENEDTQSHLLKCPIINAGKTELHSEYSDIFVMNVNLQIDVTKEIMENMKIREAFRKGV